MKFPPWKTFLVSGLGLGCLPLAPGSWGTLGGVALCWVMQPLHPVAYLLLILAAEALVVPLITDVENRMGRKDPPWVVIDELLAFPLVMFLTLFRPGTILLGLVLFRIADIAKPWPCRRLQALPGGWGVIADDLAAAVYAWAVLHLAIVCWPALQNPLCD